MNTVSLEEYLRVSNELETLRGVVEAVQALADEWQAAVESGAIQDAGERGCWSLAARDLRAALVPVPSGALVARWADAVLGVLEGKRNG